MDSMKEQVKSAWGVGKKNSTLENFNLTLSLTLSPFLTTGSPRSFKLAAWAAAAAVVGGYYVYHNRFGNLELTQIRILTHTNP